MARSTSFRAFRRALQKSLFHASHPELRNALEDHEQSSRLAREARALGSSVSLHERREFLRSSLALGLTALPLTAFVANCATPPKSSAESLESPPAGGIGSGEPVIVLGGGLAGLTAAYRLGRAGVNCQLFEAMPRLGGRVFTRDRFNAEGMFCEMGGELIDSDHEDILGLARELGVAHDDFRPYDARIRHHQFYFDGRRYFDSDLTAACEPIAHRLLRDMRAVFQDFQDPVVTYDRHTPAAEKFDRISLQEYLDGMADVDRWVRDSINMAYLTEYGLDTGEQSCINLMMLIDPVAEHGFGIFGQSDEALRIRGGNSRLIEALGRAIETRSRIFLGHRLARIEDKGHGLALTFETDGGPRTYSASHVICTVPFSILKGVEGLDRLDLSPVKRRTIAELGFGQNTKHMLGFKTRHWRKPQTGIPGASGYTFTDLPSQTLWDTSRAQKGESGIMTTFLGGSAAVDPARGSVDAILSDLEAICPGTREQYDGNHAIYRWPQHPYSKGSYTCPRPGQYTTLIGSPKEPELGGRLLFAGEHVSEKCQGYMNGAVQTGNQAVKTLLARLRAPESDGHRHKLAAEAAF